MELLTAEEIAQYHRDGAVLLKKVISDEHLSLLEQGLEESHKNPGKRFATIRSPQGEGESFLESFPSQKNPFLKKLIAESPIAEIAARAMKAPSAQLVLDQVFYKRSGFINPTPWHQDTPFLRVRGQDMIRVWLTCDYSPRTVTLKMVRGSHLWNVVYSGVPDEAYRTNKSDSGKMFAYDASLQDNRPPCPDIANHEDSFDILTWDVEPGDALVFNGNMIHAAGGCENHPTPRRAYTSMWGGPNLRYIIPQLNALPTLAEVNRITLPDNVCIGDYTDAFPLGWTSNH